MKDELTDLEKKLLEGLDIFGAEDIAYFSSYGIISVGNLLGVTKGLLDTSAFGNLSDKERLISELYSIIPEEIIEKYRRFDEKHETGWLGRLE